MKAPQPIATRHLYDVIVVGARAAPSLVTALLALKGLKVLQVPHEAFSYAERGFIFPLHTQLMARGSASADGPLDVELNRLGLLSTFGNASQNEGLQVLEKNSYRELLPLQPPAPGLPNQFDSLETERRRGTDFLENQDFPPMGFIERFKFRNVEKSFTDWQREAPFSKHLVSQLLPWLAPVEGLNPWGTSRALGRFVSHSASGPNALESASEHIIKRARELGADVLNSGECVSRLVIEKNFATGVRIADTTYRAPFVVNGLAFSALLTLLESEKQALLKKKEPALESSRELLTVHAIVPGRGLPPGLRSLSLVPHAALGAILLQVSDAVSTEKNKNENMKRLTISLVAPAAIKSSGDKAIKSFIDNIWNALRDVMPFTRAHVQFESSPWLRDETSEGDELFSLHSTSLFSVTGRPFVSSISHLTHASHEQYPGLGLEGEALAARRVVQFILSHSKALNKAKKLG